MVVVSAALRFACSLLLLTCNACCHYSDTPKHKAFVALAAILFWLVALGFPAAVFLYFLWLDKHGWLWVQVSADTEDAIYDEARCAHFIADADAERNFGFLFVSYEPNYW